MKIIATVSTMLVALALASVATAGPTANEVASYYAGKPMTVVRDETGGGMYGRTFGQPWVDDNRIWLMGGLYDALADERMFEVDPTRLRDVRGVGYTDSALFWDNVALEVLLHEAMHHRFPTAPEGAVECAAYLSYPGALERFYGITIGSPRSMRAWVFRTYELDCGWFAR